MEAIYDSETAPVETTDHIESQSLIMSFDNYYYEVAAFADMHKLTMMSQLNTTMSSFLNQQNNGYEYILSMF